MWCTFVKNSSKKYFYNLLYTLIWKQTLLKHKCKYDILGIRKKLTYKMFLWSVSYPMLDSEIEYLYFTACDYEIIYYVTYNMYF